MSQSGPLQSSSAVSSSVQTLTGNSGGAVSPDAGHNINLVGNNATGIDVVGNPGLNTLTIIGEQASDTQRGTVELATSAETIAGVSTSLAVTPAGLDAKLGTQTAHGVAIGAGTGSAISWTAVGTAGQVLTSNGAGLDPTFQPFGGGDVVGPASSTDEAIARWDGATGKLLQNSTVGLSDTGTIYTITANGSLTVVSDGTGALNLGTNATAHTTTLGSTTATSDTAIQSGSGGITVTTSSNGAITANSGTGTISISTDGSATAVNLATGAAVKTTTVGSTNSTSATTLQSGSGALNVTSTNGALTINSGTGALSISNDASATTVAVATGAAVKTSTFGSTNSTSATTIQSGSGALNITATNGAITANSGTGTIGISTDATNTTLNIGTGAGVKTVALGSSNTTSSTTINAGSGGIVMPSLTGVLAANGASPLTASTVTQYNVLVGGASNAITSIAPSATSGVPLISQGAAANPAFGTAVVAGGGTGITSATAYAVLCGGTTSTNPFQSIASVGTSGQILTSNGAGALPTFQSSSSLGTLVFLQSKTASSSASIDFTSQISATYTVYKVIFSNVVPATDATTLNMNVSTNNGSSWIVTNYQSGCNVTAYNSTAMSNNNSTTTILLTNTVDNAFAGVSGYIDLYNVGNGQLFMSRGECIYKDTANNAVIGWHGATNTDTSVDAVQFLMSSGNLATGTFTLYGIKQS